MSHAQSERELQRSYYAATAERYDDMHLDGGREHQLALEFLVGAIQHLRLTSILDVGSGTGRALLRLREALPAVSVMGVEPVEELRQVGHSKGIAAEDLVDGDATALAFTDGQFDLVCSFGVLHHVERPERAVAEMLRVSRRAVFISDSNNFGQGGTLARFVKQSINACGLWGAANFLKTRGRGYMITEGDGLAYSYSVFNNLPLIRSACENVHLLSTVDAGPNLYRSAGHVAVLGIK